jgi:hypothetical protein
VTGARGSRREPCYDLVVFVFEGATRAGRTRRATPTATRTTPGVNPPNKAWQSLATAARSGVGGSIQRKLKVGAVDDVHEREADRVAEAVVRMPLPAPAHSQTSPAPTGVQRVCAECEGEVQRSAESAAGKGGGELGAGTSAAILGLRGGGRPLSAGERAFFEPRFGVDFSRVRVHTGGGADQAARAVHARAFTLGSEIAFRSGQYNPNAEAGRRVLAHELAHVLQQGELHFSEETLAPGTRADIAPMALELGHMADWQRGPARRVIRRQLDPRATSLSEDDARALSDEELNEAVQLARGTPPAAAPPKPLPTPDQVCAIKPELCAAEAMPPCTSTDCQPADLQTVVAKSFVDPADWFEGLDSERRSALTAIFNRMCRYGLWCHVRLLLRIVPGEAPVTVGGQTFRVPGSTPSVYLMSRSGAALGEALVATGRFCIAWGLGASEHPKQITLREISSSDSLHISIGPGDQLDAHIDRHSPVVEHPGSSFCPNLPSPAAISHILREWVPEKARKRLGIPGLEVVPEPAPRAPVPEGAPQLEPALISITLRGPVRGRSDRSGDAPPLDRRTEERLSKEIPARVRRDALVPSGAKRDLSAVARAREQAGPDEERALIAALEAARERVESFADAHEFAKDLARRMDQARRRGQPAFMVQLGPTYVDLSLADTKALLAEIRHIARIVRALLAERAAGVSKVWVLLGDDVMWDVDF